MALRACQRDHWLAGHLVMLLALRWVRLLALLMAHGKAHQLVVRWARMRVSQKELWKGLWLVHYWVLMKEPWMAHRLVNQLEQSWVKRLVGEKVLQRELQ